MKYSLLALITLCVMSGCAHKAAHKQSFVFQNLHGNVCDADTRLSHWDAKTGAFVIVCKSEGK